MRKKYRVVLRKITTSNSEVAASLLQNHGFKLDAMAYFVDNMSEATYFVSKRGI